MFNHTLWSLIAKIFTTNASISPLNLLNVHKILFYTYSLAIYNFFLLTMSSEPYIKWSKWPWVSFLLLNCLPTRKKNERSENMKLIVKLPPLLPSAMVWNFFSFLGSNLVLKFPYLLSSANIWNSDSLFGLDLVFLQQQNQRLFVVDPIENHVSFYCNDYMAPLSLG